MLHSMSYSVLHNVFKVCYIVSYSMLHIVSYNVCKMCYIVCVIVSI